MAAVIVIGQPGAFDRVEVPVRDRTAPDDRRGEAGRSRVLRSYGKALEVVREAVAHRGGIEAEVAA